MGIKVAGGTRPENTLAAFEVATWNEVDILELDLHVTLDDVTFFLFKKAGFRITLWVVNDKDRAYELVLIGVDGLISNYPQTIIP